MITDTEIERCAKGAVIDHLESGTFAEFFLEGQAIELRLTDVEYEELSMRIKPITDRIVRELKDRWGF